MNSYDHNTVEEALINTMLDEMGYAPTKLEDDGKIQRFSTNPKNPGDTAGWCLFHSDGRPNAVFGDYRTGYKSKWKWNDPNYQPPTPEQRKQQAQERDATKRAKAEQLEAQYIQAANKAYEIWEAAKQRPATQAHPYLWRKMCMPYGLRLDEDNNLLMPLSNAKEHLWSFQRISPKRSKYNKMLLKDSKKHGMFYVVNCKIPDLARCHTCYVGEGFATAATYAQHFLGLSVGEIGTGIAVVCAVDSGNLEPVIQGIYQKYPHLKFAIFADNDQLREQETGNNPGKTAAEAIKAKYPYVVDIKYPPFPPNAPLELTDFNDLYVWQQKTQGGSL